MLLQWIDFVRQMINVEVYCSLFFLRNGEYQRDRIRASMIIKDSLTRRNECITCFSVASKIFVDLLGVVLKIRDCQVNWLKAVLISFWKISMEQTSSKFIMIVNLLSFWNDKSIISKMIQSLFIRCAMYDWYKQFLIGWALIHGRRTMSLYRTPTAKISDVFWSNGSGVRAGMGSRNIFGASRGIYIASLRNIGCDYWLWKKGRSVSWPSA